MRGTCGDACPRPPPRASRGVRFPAPRTDRAAPDRLCRVVHPLPYTLCTRGDSMLNFCVLGPLEVKSPTEILRVKGALQRTLLATLIVNARKFVPSDELINELWGEDPPDHVEN